MIQQNHYSSSPLVKLPVAQHGLFVHAFLIPASRRKGGNCLMQLFWTCFHLQWAPIKYSELLVPMGFFSPFLMCFGLPGTWISFMQQHQLMSPRLGLYETCHIFWDGYTAGCCLSGIKVARACALTSAACRNVTQLYTCLLSKNWKSW